MGRKQKAIHYLYKTTCTITGRYYIGMHSTNNLDDGYLGSGKRLRRSVRKHGEENHVKEILEFFDTREALVEAEKRAITSEMLVDKDCMNLMSGGTGGLFSLDHVSKAGILGGAALKKRLEEDSILFFKFSKLSSERIKRTYAAGKIKPPNWNGKKHSEVTKKKISDIRRGKGTGNLNSQSGTMWITNGVENRKIKKEGIIPEGWYKGRKTNNNTNKKRNHMK